MRPVTFFFNPEMTPLKWFVETQEKYLDSELLWGLLKGTSCLAFGTKEVGEFCSLRLSFGLCVSKCTMSSREELQEEGTYIWNHIDRATLSKQREPASLALWTQKQKPFSRFL